MLPTLRKTCSRLVILETPKVAVSAVALGTVAGVQLAGYDQYWPLGVAFHVALPAGLDWMPSNKMSVNRRLVDFFMRFFYQAVCAHCKEKWQISGALPHSFIIP